ncbi:MAG: sialate O-acetylesterase [Verrucomicrobiota bacterium]|jgi:Carbohydrate esterase, sialic acid-specific acetylesterase
MRLPLCLLACLATFIADAKPLKVYVLVGQSNMEGHAKVETIDYISEDPATAPLLKRMLGPDGKPATAKNVWISYYTGIGEKNGEGFGKLTTGYGSRQDPAKDGGKIGPEYTFGLAMDRAGDGPVLLIKAAWGGKSLNYDFRSPGAGPYPRTKADLEKDKHPLADSGHYYRLMMAHAKQVLADPGRVCPAYNPKEGYELAGFIWLQGFNDMVDTNFYPKQPKGAVGNRFALYSDTLTAFIRDVRKDLGAPRLPFVIGVMGVGGKDPGSEDNLAFREAMAAPATLPEFKGNVAAVRTAPFWDEKLGAIQDKKDKVRQMSYELKNKGKRSANADGKMTEPQQKAYLKDYEAKLISADEAAMLKRGASNGGYHYLGCAKTFALMGEAFAEANLQMRSAQK